MNIRHSDGKLLLKLSDKELFYEGYTWLFIVDRNIYLKAWEVIRYLQIRIDTDMMIAVANHTNINQNHRNLSFDLQQIYKIRSTNHESCVRTFIGYYTIDGLQANFIDVEDRKNFNKLPYRIAQIDFNKTIVNIEELSYDLPAVNSIINHLITIFNARLVWYIIIFSA